VEKVAGNYQRRRIRKRIVCNWTGIAKLMNISFRDIRAIIKSRKQNEKEDMSTRSC
jgi:hypothetical protein